MTEKYIVTWDMFHMHARTLAGKLLPNKQWKGIIAVSRGGLFPAAVISRELDIRVVKTVCIASYDHDKQGDLEVLYKSEIGDGAGYIVIDDLVDTGVTAKAVREIYPKAKFVTVFAKPLGASFVDEYVLDIPQDTWIEQPWDLGLEFVAPLAKIKS